MDSINQPALGALQVTPPVAIASITWLGGLHLPDLVYILTIIYTTLMIGRFVWTMGKDFNTWIDKRRFAKLTKP